MLTPLALTSKAASSIEKELEVEANRAREASGALFFTTRAASTLLAKPPLVAIEVKPKERQT